MSFHLFFFLPLNLISDKNIIISNPYGVINNKSIQMMAIKSFITRFDMFPAQLALRNKGSSIEKNIYTGFFSMILDGIFYYLVLNALINSLTLQSIDAKEITKSNRNLSNEIRNVAIGVGLQGMNLNRLQHIFQIKAFSRKFDGSVTEIRVHPCNRQYWEGVDDLRYTSLNIGNGLCLDKTQTYIKGIVGLEGAEGVYIIATSCDNSTSPIVCAPQTDINNFLSSNSDPLRGNIMAASLYILNVDINPFIQQPIEYSIYEKSLWLVMSNNQEAIIQAFLSTYQISTDKSFMPWTDISKISGYYLSQIVVNTIVKTTPSPLYIQVFILGSPIKKAISRSYGKFVQILGFAFGVIALLTNFFGGIIGSYNRYRLELSVGEGVFRTDKDTVLQENFHFLLYLKYVIYDWAKNVFCCRLDWKDCQMIEYAKKEAGAQLQFKLIIKRLNHLEKVVGNTVPKDLESLAYLIQANTYQESIKRKLISQYCQKFVLGLLFQTIQSIEQSQKQQKSDLNISSNKIEPVNCFELQFQTDSLKSLPQSHSLKKMAKFVNMYLDKYGVTEETFSVDQMQLQIENELASKFFESDQAIRSKLINKIPLGVLYRFMLWKRKERNSNDTKIFLQDSFNNNDSTFKK